MMRHGYETCGGCHISPAGGDVLTNYGKTLSEEALSTWSYEGESATGHINLGLPSNIAIGGDYRILNMAMARNNQTTYRSIKMQKDVELAVKFADFWVGGSWGYYNGDSEESRRHYLIWGGETHKIRIGKYLTSYGLLQADHTAYNRQTLDMGEGSESYNAEYSAVGRIGELFFTGIILTKHVSPTGKITYNSEKSGGAARVNLFAASWFHIGASSMLIHTKENNRLTYGGFGTLVPFKALVILADVNEVFDGNFYDLYSYVKFNLEVYKGVQLNYENNYSKAEYVSNRKNSVGLDWFPRPHFEFLAKVERSLNNSFILMSHYYF